MTLNTTIYRRRCENDLCSQWFETTAHNRRFCSRWCQRKVTKPKSYSQRKRRQAREQRRVNAADRGSQFRAVPPGQAFCLGCDKLFHRRSVVHEWCSRECRLLHFSQGRTAQAPYRFTIAEVIDEDGLPDLYQLYPPLAAQRGLRQARQWAGDLGDVEAEAYLAQQLQVLYDSNKDFFAKQIRNQRSDASA